MFFPIHVVDLELADGETGTLAVSPGYRAARVLVRWHGLPVGTLQASVVNGVLERGSLTGRAWRELPDLRAAAVRRGLGASPPAARAASVDVSVIVCTRDRPDDLARCLDALARLDPAPREVLVVDNAPATGATAELVLAYPHFRYLREDQPGLDRARNCGLAAAEGAVIAFTDDDVVVDRGWAGALANAFEADPSVGLVTGLIEPAELETEAQVLFERYGGFGRGYRRQYVQARPGARLSWSQIGAGQLGAGANMAVRRELFAAVGGFDPALDVGTPSRGGGDHEMFYRLIKSGCLCLYEPAALVRHRHRRTRPELRKLLADYGHATRCFFERVELNFPEDRPGVRRLQRWWWREWALRRLGRAWMQPGWFPFDLVWAEVAGYRAGAGAYPRFRFKYVPDEAQRPDAFRVPRTPVAPPSGSGLVVIDLAKPLRTLDEGCQAEAITVFVQSHGRAIGTVRIASLGQPISEARLADEISRELWPRLWDGTATAPTEEKKAAACSSPADEIEVSIVVATCDRPEPLRRCLASLAALETRRRLQIIVVDNRPGRPRTAEVVAAFPGVQLVEEPRPGSSYARNAGIAAARGAIIAMTDDDMQVAPDWLERLLAPFARADVAAVTGNTLPARVATAAEQHFELYGGFSRGFRPRQFDRDWFTAFRRCAAPTWQIGGTGNAAFRAEIFDWPGIAGFDERLGSGVPTGVGEDTKLFYDLLHAGQVIQYEPTALAWHHHRVSYQDLRRQLYAYSKGHVAYHLLTFRQYGDKRALVRVLIELPLALARRSLARLRGRYRYPWRLLAIELAGTLAGPWSLLAACRHVRRHGLGARRAPALGLRPDRPQPLIARGVRQLEVAR